MLVLHKVHIGTKLFNFGTQGITPVNVIDTTQTDALLNVAGQLGYGIDGYTLVQDSLVIFAADNNLEVRNQIYQRRDRYHTNTTDFAGPEDEPPLWVLSMIAVEMGLYTILRGF